MKRVVVTASLPGDALDGLEGRARVRVLNSRGILSESTLQKALRSADGAVTIPSDPVSERVLEGCPRLKVVANCAVGTDNIDLEAARRLGIAVTNTPDVLNEATADLTWALILGVARRTAEGDRLLRRRRFRGWKPDFLLGVDLGGKTLGIVGMGHRPVMVS